MTEWILLSLAIGLINLTNIRFGLLFIGEPLVVGALTGWYLKDQALGLYLGSVIQFMWIRSIPIGVKVQVNYTMMTFLTIFLVFYFKESAYPLCFLIAWFFSFLGRGLEIFMKRLSNSLVDDMMKKIEKVRFTPAHLGFMIFHVLSFSILTFIALSVTTFVMNPILAIIPAKLLDSFSFSYPFLALYALAMFFHSIDFHFKLIYLLIGILLGLVMLLLGISFNIKIIVLSVFAVLVSLLHQRFLTPGSAAP